MNELVIENGVLVRYTGGKFASSVTVPSGVNKIGKDAFKDSYIKGIELPEGITEIGTGAFENCRFESIRLPESLEHIGARAFAYCESLKSIDIPQNVRFISDEAFESCYELESVNFSEKLSFIGETAFGSCEALKEVVIPRFADISKYSFCGCTSLEKVVFSDDCFTKIPEGAFCDCQEIGSVHLGEGVIKVENLAFANSLIFDLYIGCSFIDIESGAFSSVMDVTYNGDEYGYASLCADLEGDPFPFSATCLKDCEEDE